VPWDPAQYLKFADHRLRPAVDLIGRIELTAPRDIYDLGSGTGNVTRLLKQRWPRARVTGIDGSAEMLIKARAVSPEIEWQKADLASFRPKRPADLLFSNAALHWLGDHERLFPALFSQLAPGGSLAVQMPRNFNAPSHSAIAEAARTGSWRAKLEPLLELRPVAEPSFYYDLLAPHAASVDIWETEYLQVLEGANPVKEWTKGTWLRRYLELLDEPDRTGFEDSYSRIVARAYPRRSDGRTLFPFRRLFIVARAPGG
jgi:trans-aconitate 2-methyltransferase